LQPEIFGIFEFLQPLETVTFDFGSCWRERRDAAVRRVRDDRRAQRFDGVRAELPIKRIVGSGARALRRALRRGFLVPLRNLAFPLCGFFRRKERLVF
jgi:hypothetical protein